MSKVFNFFKKLFKNTPDEVQLEEKTEKKEKIKLKEMYDKEPGEVKRSYTDELGNYARIRTAHDGEELWRFRSKDSNITDCKSLKVNTIKEINAAADDFKTIKKFVSYIKEELEKV